MRLSALWIYPLKSGGGVSLDAWELDAMGLAEDRRFMLVDPSGNFITQRQEPRLALLAPSFQGEMLIFDFPGMPSLAVPRHPRWQERQEVEIWGDRCSGLRAPDSLNAWFGACLGREDVTIVWFDPLCERPVDPNYAAPDDRVGFADGFPLLLTTEVSLQELNRRLDAPIGMDRFRPNLVFDGEVAFAEDAWKEVRIGKLTLRVAKPCGRCQIPNIDPRTGVMGKEPMRTLKSFRRKGGDIVFGQNLIHNGVGTLFVGSDVVAY
jgi:uncharacterized protein YcbX